MAIASCASCEFFTAQLLQVQGSLGVGCSDSFTSLLLLEGAARLIPDGGGEVLELARGASIFLPAGCTAHIEAVGGTAEILSSRV